MEYLKIMILSMIPVTELRGAIPIGIAMDLNPTRVYIEYFLKILFANVAILIVYFILKPFVYIPVNLFTVLIFEVLFMLNKNKFVKNKDSKNIA